MKLDLDGLDGLLRSGPDAGQRDTPTLRGLGGPVLFPAGLDDETTRGVPPVSLPPPSIVPPSASVFADENAATVVRPPRRRPARLVWAVLAPAALLSLILLWPQRPPPAPLSAAPIPTVSPGLGRVLAAPAALASVTTSPVPASEPFLAPLRFRVAGATPDAVDAAELRRFAAELARRCQGRRILLTGHTCNMGPARQNLRLGRQRARHVRDLLRAAGVDEPMDLRSAGSRAPLASNASEPGRRQNRRVTASCSNDPSTKR